MLDIANVKLRLFGLLLKRTELFSEKSTQMTNESETVKFAVLWKKGVLSTLLEQDVKIRNNMQTVQK